MENVFDETAAVLAARNGDQAAFGALVLAYQRRAYAAAYGFTGNREDALELSQEAFVKAFRAMGRFDTAMPFYPWLHRIIRNTSLNYLKKQRRHGETSLEALMAVGFDARAMDPDPRGNAEMADLRAAIAGAMARLSQDQREILHLRHFMELSYQEIAQCLDIPPGTVMSRLHAARKALRRALEEAGGIFSMESTTETVNS